MRGVCLSCVSSLNGSGINATGHCGNIVPECDERCAGRCSTAVIGRSVSMELHRCAVPVDDALNPVSSALAFCL